MADNISLPPSTIIPANTNYVANIMDPDFWERRASLGTSASPVHGRGESDYGSFLNFPQDDDFDKSSRYSARGSFSGHASLRQGDEAFEEHTPFLIHALERTHSLALTQVTADYKDDPHHPQSPYKSTFAQSIFNSVNILIGIGILSLALGIRCGGWVIGMTIFVYCCLLTNYTAKLLARCLDYGAGGNTYGDMGYIAFGDRGRWLVSILFLTELCTSSIALVVLLGDALVALFPTVPMSTFRLISLFILTPLTFLPVRKLSYTSLLGIISAACLVIVVVVDGLTKEERPGSLRDPMPTDIWPSDWTTVPLSFGLIMAGFAGHAVFPTVYRDMEEPKHYKTMVNWTYIVTTLVYFCMAACGYLMFGSTVMQEITQNIMSTPGYNPTLNRMAVSLIAVNPIAKYALTLNPVNLTWELALFGQERIDAWCNNGRGRRTFLRVIGRIAISSLVVGIATVYPGFDKVMALLGAFFSFMISGIFPIVCHLRLFSNSMPIREKILNWILLIISSILALTGTAWSFL
ncbi:hypothetical protein BZG36_04222 [Bifiguratus adelaidae]|uniref:Amino acid transporter transmembrane domain-containing protein n=1 Tax=Bifiguratus adelaidae TaxID=1938954 RepID=A0A261XY90_9FUNG|nr:hypothetical protein BZG36_04222 [Bifiguratus adelaidae]